MTDEEIIIAAADNQIAQWVADLEKRPSITLNYQYNQAIYTLNALQSTGVINVDYDPASAGETFQGEVFFRGFSAMSDLFTARLAAGDFDVWPIETV